MSHGLQNRDTKLWGSIVQRSEYRTDHTGTLVQIQLDPPKYRVSPNRGCSSDGQERLPTRREIGGSNPSTPTTSFTECGNVQ